MTKEGKIVAISYFWVHFLVEVACFALITKYVSLPNALIISFVFDFFAFVPQFLFGIINVRHKKLDIGSIGVLLMLIGVLFFDTSSYIKLIMFALFIGIGNTIMHECGAISTVITGSGKLFPSALFVAGGSFGLVTGKLISGMLQTKIIVILALALMELIVLLTNKYWLKDDVKYPDYHITKKEVPVTTIVYIATFITFARSFIGYAIPISWNKSVWQTLFLFMMMGTGKAFGGFLSDKIGARNVSLITTIGCIPFLILGENIMMVSIFGVFLFSMTMSITYGMLLSVIKNNPGLAFGYTTIGLFLGICPVFIVSISKQINIILIVILSILAMLGFLKTLSKEK